MMFSLVTAMITALPGIPERLKESDDRNKRVKELLPAVAAGDRGAFAELYELMRASVYGLALSYLRSSHDAYDAAQDTFVRVFEAAPEYRPTGSAESWIFTICRNICVSRLRASGRMTLLDDQEWDAIPDEESGLSFEEKELLGSAMKRLDDTERRIVILHAVAGEKHRTIARELDIPLPTVLSKYARALKKLRKYMEGDDSE